jgi:outer membrane protein assembly factor BamB
MVEGRPSVRIVTAVLVLIVASFVLNAPVSSAPSDPKTGVTILDIHQVEPGYVLYTPLLGDPSQGTATVTYLINVYGEVVKSWPMAVGAGQYAQLLADGTLIYAGQSEKEIVVPPGDGGLLQIIDWDGEVLWSYENDFLHHDMEMLPDGNIAALIYSLVPDGMVAEIQGGLPGTELEDGSIWGDSIIEVDPDGEIINQIDVWQYLDPVEDPIHPDINRNEWTHANSLRFVESNPITGTEAYLVSHRQISVVALVDRATGELIWKWGHDDLAQQHDARMLENGNILIFDNGEDPKDTAGGHTVPRSRIVEVDPRTNEIIWTYASPVLTAWRFFSPLISGAHRTPNGNTFINEGMPGRLFEVTPEGETVWEYISPHGRPVEGDPVLRETWIFRATKYTLDQVTFPADLPGPLERLEEPPPGDGPVDAADIDDDDGDIEWWVLLIVGVGAAVVFFVVGVGVARSMSRA